MNNPVNPPTNKATDQMPDHNVKDLLFACQHPSDNRYSNDSDLAFNALVECLTYYHKAYWRVFADKALDREAYQKLVGEIERVATDGDSVKIPVIINIITKFKEAQG